MAWNYNAVPILPLPINGVQGLPIGLKITKTYIDETGNELFTTDATVEEALVEAEEGFALEYAQAAREVFSNKLNFLLNYENNSRELAAGSDANVLGFELRKCVETLNVLSGLY